MSLTQWLIYTSFFHFSNVIYAQRRVAMIAEMIHSASLIHDDVIDQSFSRRGKPSVNVLWNHKKVSFFLLLLFLFTFFLQFFLLIICLSNWIELNWFRIGFTCKYTIETKYIWCQGLLDVRKPEGANKYCQIRVLT